MIRAQLLLHASSISLFRFWIDPLVAGQDIRSKIITLSGGESFSSVNTTPLQRTHPQRVASSNTSRNRLSDTHGGVAVLRTAGWCWCCSSGLVTTRRSPLTAVAFPRVQNKGGLGWMTAWCPSANNLP